MEKLRRSFELHCTCPTRICLSLISLLPWFFFYFISLSTLLIILYHCQKLLFQIQMTFIWIIRLWNVAYSHSYYSHRFYIAERSTKRALYYKMDVFNVLPTYTTFLRWSYIYLSGIITRNLVLAKKEAYAKIYPQIIYLQRSFAAPQVSQLTD